MTRSNIVLQQLKEELAKMTSGPSLDRVGIVFRAGDGVADVRGLSETRYAELLEFESEDGKNVLGMALNLEEHSIRAIILGDAARVREGQRVRSTDTVLSLPVSPALLGRVIDPLGNPEDGGPAIPAAAVAQYPLEKIAPGVITREPVKTPLHTGIKAIDAMIPIGRGQRELIIGDRGTGKTAMVVDTIIHQGREKRYPIPICVYVAIGQKKSKTALIVEKLRRTGALRYTVVVLASAADAAALQYLAPYAGCAIGEYFMDQGKDALVIYDDLSKHAWAYRQLSLLLRRPPGREAYPGDVFYLHSRLLERAAKLNAQHGGGSLTALPVIETQLGDISAYIPTNTISITDGQIYLEPELFYQDIRPAVNVGLSVSRVGSAAQTKAMKKISGALRLELAQFRELAAFVQFGQDLDPATKQKIERGRRLTELLKQRETKGMPFEEQTAVIFAAVNGFLDPVAIPRVSAFEDGFLRFLHERHGKLLETIRESGELSRETEETLRAATKDFAENYFSEKH